MVDRTRSLPTPSPIRTAWFGLVSPEFYGQPCGCQETTVPPVPPVTFNWTMFTTLFPEFGCLTEAQGQAYFMMAGLYVANDPCNPAICILPQLLNLVTAHVAWLLCPKDASGNPATSGSNNGGSLVGRINSATQGSVSVGTTLDGHPGSPSEAFYAQTRYGLLAWQAMAQFRLFRYTVSPTLVALGTGPGGFLPGGFWNGGFV